MTEDDLESLDSRNGVPLLECLVVVVSEPNELNWHPQSDDPAFEAGCEFLERNRDTSDGFHGQVPLWHGWMVRQAFWCGVKWAREQRSLPVMGSVGDEGKVTWKDKP